LGPFAAFSSENSLGVSIYDRKLSILETQMEPLSSQTFKKADVKPPSSSRLSHQMSGCALSSGKTEWTHKIPLPLRVDFRQYCTVKT